MSTKSGQDPSLRSAALAAEPQAVRLVTTDTPSGAAQDGLALDDIFSQQDSAADYNMAGSEVVRRRLEFVREATALGGAILSALPFEAEKQHAIRVLSSDAWSNLLVSVRVGLWDNAPESFALLRCGVEASAILAAAVEQRLYRTTVSEFAARQRRLSFAQAVEGLGEAGKRITRLHGDLSNYGSHATGGRMRFASYSLEGESYDRFGWALDPEATAMALLFALDLSLYLVTTLEASFIQDSKAFPWKAELEGLRAKFREARKW